MLHIAVYGPKLRAEAARLARAEESALVVCGHSHVPFIVFGVLDVRDRRVSMRHVSCETGQVWSP
jgi:predicted SpoU family rRNA methylase